MTRLRTTALVLVVAVATLVGAAPARAVTYPDIGQTQAFDAPIDKKGGLLSPHAACRNWQVEARVRWRVTRLSTGTSRTYRWRGGGPGMAFPRVPTGRYRVVTVARCGESRGRQVERLAVREKTLDGTVSRAEFRQVRRGMTRARVARIVGNDGRDPWSYRGRTTRTYDMMAFWRWSLITYRDGRVVRKMWDVGHD
jgi:hypothetical protein